MAEQVKHTPGPWRVSRGRIEYGPYVAGDGFAVAKVFRDPTEWEANAALIAAAPAMHHQLQVLRETVRAQLDPEHCAHGKTDWAHLLGSTDTVLATAIPKPAGRVADAEA